MALTEAKPFANYLERPARLPQAVWWVARLAVLAGTVWLMWLIATRPQTGLDLFWKLVIPVMPLAFVVLPGAWRQVCPMALMNQIPRSVGFSRGLTLPMWAKTSAYIIAVSIFFLAVVFRHIVFNTDGSALVALMAGALGLAFAGGVVFKGRSGWCGTFCPLGPIQRVYGQSPLAVVRNGYCPSCLGCQKNCYDFNPRAAIHADLADADEWYAGHREFFVAALPGLMIGYFTTTGPAQSGLLGYFGHMGLWITVTLGLYMAFTRIVRISRYKAALFFSMGALVIFYWFAAPLIASGLSEVTGLALPGVVGYLFLGAALLVAPRVIVNGLRDERAFEALNAPRAEPKVGVDLGKLREAGAAAAPASAGDLIVDRGSGRSFTVDAGRSLLEGMETAGIKIDYGCRMGMCGADPVAVVEGHDALDEPSATELETLERLGLKGRARLACVCHALDGGVTIDTTLDPRSLAEPEPQAPAVDHGEVAGISRVVIIGNGAAGITAAEEIRRLSPSCTIEVVARENDYFYNRMAIARLLYGRTAMSGLYLNQPDWPEKRNVNVWLNTTAVTIDRDAHEVILGTSERLPYDRLVLAQGSSAIMPPIPGSDLPGCFVLREAGGAMQIRAWRQEHQCRTAVVLGGGVLGIEAADALRRLNLSVTILQRGPRLMDRQLDAKGSAILARYLEGLGMRVITDAVTERCVGTDRLSGVVLGDGEEIEAEIMVACAGIRPNAEIAAEAGLEIGRGVKVDGSMRTSDPDIFAIGDVAELPGTIGGLWAVSTAQAKVAAAAMFGREVAYAEPNTLVSLKMDGIDVKGYGRTAAEGPGQEAVVDPGESEDEHRMLVVENGRMVGAVFVGPPGTGRHVTDLVERKPDLTPVLSELRRGNWDALGEVLRARPEPIAAE